MILLTEKLLNGSASWYRLHREFCAKVHSTQDDIPIQLLC